MTFMVLVGLWWWVFKYFQGLNIQNVPAFTNHSSFGLCISKKFRFATFVLDVVTQFWWCVTANWFLVLMTHLNVQWSDRSTLVPQFRKNNINMADNHRNPESEFHHLPPHTQKPIFPHAIQFLPLRWISGMTRPSEYNAMS
jgi:hypothetical protein